MLTEGEKAPSFKLKADSGADVKLEDFRGKYLILYFYPKDMTPGCTRQATGFTEAKRRLVAAGAAVVGVSKDTVASHCTFRDKYAINFPLLSDPELVAHKAYDAYGEKTLYGKKSMGTIRSTFVIDPDGVLLHAFRGVKVDGHIDKVLDVIRGNASSASRAPKKSAGAGAKKKG
jgi:peroxiredoxin Q/BCP